MAPGDQFPRRHRFWLPLIALWSGMRIEEICQLYVEDIKPYKDIVKNSAPIATKKSDAQQLPFFSKITLKNSIKRLRTIGVNAKISFIKVNSQVFIKKKAKPAQAQGSKIKK